MDRYEAEFHDGRPNALEQPGRTAARLPRPVRAVVFDLDGTLLDTEQLYRVAFHAALAERGWALPDRAYDGLIGLPGTARRALLLRLLGPSFPVAEFFECYARHRNAALAGGVPVKPGVAVLLGLLESRGLPYGIATSASRRTAEANLASAGLPHRFAVLVTRDDVIHGKPHPESFLQAASRLGTPPEDCLAVEDSAPGIAAAHAAGLMVAGIPDAVPPGSDTLRRCDVILDSLHALHRLLAEHAGDRRA